MAAEIKNEPIAQQAAPMELHARMESSLEHALGKLSSLEMPKKHGAQVQRVEITPEEPAQEAQAPLDQAPIPPTPLAKPSEPVQQAWGPAQQKALQEILTSNQTMEAELRALREERDSLRGIVDTGDLQAFAQRANLSESDMLESLSNQGKAPVTRPYVRKLESTVQSLSDKLAALESHITQRDTQARQERELSEITQQLNVKPEYGILKKIPDAAQRVQALIKQHEAAARDRGEVASLTVDQAAAMFKGNLLGSLKQLLTDDSVKQELGLMGESAPPDNVKAPRPSKAITGKMTSQGSIQRTQGYNPEEQLRRALGYLKG